MAKLKITGDEEQVIIVDNEEDNTWNDLISLCLLGWLYTSGSFHSKAMKIVLCNLWKPNKGLVTRDLDDNLFAFQFFSIVDRDYVLNEGPWAFDGCILILKEMTSLEGSFEVEFLIVWFWFKAYDVPAKKQTVSFARIIASNIGQLVSCDEASMFRVDKALCFQVDLDITKPFRRAMHILINTSGSNLSMSNFQISVMGAANLGMFY